MQTELLDTKKWRTRVELSTAIFDWMGVLYNRTRRRSSLGNISPVEFEGGVSLTGFHAVADQCGSPSGSSGRCVC